MLAAALAAIALLWIVSTVLLLGLHGTVLSVRASTSPALLDAIAARAALSDADRSAWQSFRSGEAQLAGPGAQYQNDITTTGQDLEQLATFEPSGSTGSQQLQTVSGQLVNYQGLVEQADAANRADIALGSGSKHDLGYAYLTYASSSLRNPQGGLLASIDQLAADDQRALDGELTSPWTAPALLLVFGAAAVLGLGCLIAAQSFVRRRFRRAVSPPVLLAAVLLCGLSAWVGLVTLHADSAFADARTKALPALTGIWRSQARAVDAEAAAFQSSANAPGGTSGGLSVTQTQPARTALDSDLASAAGTGGLVIGIPVLAATIAGLAFLGLKPRLDEYRG